MEMKQAQVPSRIMSIADVLAEARRRVAALVPENWKVQVDAPAIQGASREQGAIGIGANAGAMSNYVFEVYLRPPSNEIVEASILRLQAAVVESGQSGLRRLVISTFLSPAAKRLLDAEDVGYIDLTGNVRLANPATGLMIFTEGADKLVPDSGAKLGSMKSRAASQVARTLVDLSLNLPITTHELAGYAGVSPAQTWRVIQLLADEGIVRRDSSGRLAQYAWQSVLERWAKDYQFDRRARPAPFLSLQGVDRVIEQLKQVNDERWAITGQFASEHYTSLAPPRALKIYAENPGALVAQLDVVPAEGAADILIAQPPNPLVLERMNSEAGINWCAPSQVFVDMWSGSGREIQQAEALFGWMVREEKSWRREP